MLILPIHSNASGPCQHLSQLRDTVISLNFTSLHLLPFKSWISILLSNILSPVICTIGRMQGLWYFASLHAVLISIKSKRLRHSNTLRDTICKYTGNQDSKLNWMIFFHESYFNSSTRSARCSLNGNSWRSSAVIISAMH